MISARPDILTLDATHFHEVCEAVNDNHFTDPKKNTFKEELLHLSEGFLNEDLSTLDKNSIHYRINAVSFFLRWALALDSRNAYTLSPQMRGLLDNLCGLWIKDSDRYVFAVTDGDFSVLPYQSDWDVDMENIKNMYGVEFSHLLVTFCVPKHLACDFLYSCVLYHEMGHFIDSYYNISERVFDGIKNRLVTGGISTDYLNKFFPVSLIISKTSLKEFLLCLRKQIAEYIADLFGAQYVGIHICNLMESVSCSNFDMGDFEHPSANCRERMVQDFLAGVTINDLLNTIIKEFKASGLELRPRFVPLAESERLEEGEPLNIQNNEELHSIIKLGWDVYFNKPSTMEAKANIGSINNQVFYGRINSAIKESIGKFLVIS